MILNKRALRGLIELCDQRNDEGLYSEDDVIGVSTSKSTIPTKANLDGVNILKYKLFPPKSFAYVADTSRRGDKIALAYNDTGKTYIVSTWYVVFRISEAAKDVILPDYLFMFFNRSEFDRYARTNSWGSAREYFLFSDMEDVEIELPPLSVQKRYVAVYKAMIANQQSYEHGLEDLKLTCEAYIEKLKNDSPLVKLSDFSWLSDKRNENEACKNVKGLTVYKQFIDTKANMSGVALNNYKVVEPGDIAYVPTTNRNGDRIACGIAEEKCIVSSTYEVLKIDKTKCDPHYLFLWFMRSEMDRYARYNSWGSAREVISFHDLGNYAIPLPDLHIQQSIANLYKSYLIRKEMNESLLQQIKGICPILIKGSLEECEE